MSDAIRYVVVAQDPILLKSIEQGMNIATTHRCVARCNSPVQVTEHLRRESVDLVLVDAEIPDLLGALPSRSVRDRPQVFALSEIKQVDRILAGLEVVEHICQPVDAHSLMVVHQRLLERRRQKIHDRDGMIFVKTDAEWIGIPLDRIVMVEAMADYVRIHLDDKRHTVYGTMKGIASKLPDERFIRVHRSYIVNLSMVERVQGNSLYIAGHVLPIGVTYCALLMERFQG